MKVYVTRHGLTEWNAADRISGITDIALTQEGLAQAQEMARQAAAIGGIERILASPMQRAQATARHALKNAMVPILPMIIGTFIGILGGSMIIEQIFAIPGVGQLYIKSINLFDYDIFMMDTVFYTFIGLLAGIVIDISYGFIDPRIRMGSKK